MPTHLRLLLTCYMRCKGINRRLRPAEFIGLFPRKGQVCEVDFVFDTLTQEVLVTVRGFQANYPYGSFKPHFFEPVAVVCLN